VTPPAPRLLYAGLAILLDPPARRPPLAAVVEPGSRRRHRGPVDVVGPPRLRHDVSTTFSPASPAQLEDPSSAHAADCLTSRSPYFNHELTRPGSIVHRRARPAGARLGCPCFLGAHRRSDGTRSRSTYAMRPLFSYLHAVVVPTPSFARRRLGVGRCRAAHPRCRHASGARRRLEPLCASRPLRRIDYPFAPSGRFSPVRRLRAQ